MNNSKKTTLLHLPLSHWGSIGVYLALTVLFVFFYNGFMGGSQSAAVWLESAWTPETDYEHGWMIPLLCIYMMYRAVKKLEDEPVQGSLKGLWLTAIGGLFCILAARSQQPRVVIGAVPFLLTGAVWCYWGRKAALTCAFPLFFLWMAIPIPGLQQATTGLQSLTAHGAHAIAGLCGVETVLAGSKIAAANGTWDSFDIVGGCSGIRSLMALLMISVVWGYLADTMALWKRIVLALSAIPLSIIGNIFRISSICLCAEYIDPSFAGKTWHDWSGLLFFFPATLLGLALLHGLLAGELPFISKRKTVTRKNNQPAATADEKGDRA